jgi:hypothetical protein
MAHSRKEERHRGDQYAFIQEKGQCKTDLVPIMFDPVHSNVIARQRSIERRIERRYGRWRFCSEVELRYRSETQGRTFRRTISARPTTHTLLLAVKACKEGYSPSCFVVFSLCAPRVKPITSNGSRSAKSAPSVPESTRNVPSKMSSLM